MKARSDSSGGESLHTGAVAFIQRFTKTLGLSPHVHVVFVDGVWFEAGGGRAEFREAGAPDEEMLFEVARRVFTRLERFLKREGYRDPTEGDAPEALDRRWMRAAREPPVLPARPRLVSTSNSELPRRAGAEVADRFRAAGGASSPGAVSPSSRLAHPASGSESGAILRGVRADARAASGGVAEAGRAGGRARRRGGRRWQRGPVPGRVGEVALEGVRCGCGAVPGLRRSTSPGRRGDATGGGAGGARRGALGLGRAGSTQRGVMPGLIRGRASGSSVSFAGRGASSGAPRVGSEGLEAPTPGGSRSSGAGSLR